MAVSSQKYGHRVRPILHVQLRCAILGLSMLSASLAHSGQLHQCQDSSGRLIFTDSPAQLHSCIPVPAMGIQDTAVPQPAYGLPHTLPAVPPTPASSYAQPPAMMSVEGAAVPAPSNPNMAPPSDPSPSPSPAESGSPCHPGLNPLNHFSAPPCQVPQDRHTPLNEATPMPESPPPS